MFDIVEGRVLLLVYLPSLDNQLNKGQVAMFLLSSYRIWMLRFFLRFYSLGRVLAQIKRNLAPFLLEKPPVPLF